MKILPARSVVSPNSDSYTISKNCDVVCCKTGNVDATYNKVKASCTAPGLNPNKTTQKNKASPKRRSSFYRDC